jgi:ABC-type bacteriocin/lantibiotic exporter with double-glycine peptidase domain
MPSGMANNFSFIVLLFFATYLLKLIFNLVLGWRQSKFIFELESMFSSMLFMNYLNQDYAYFLQNNSSILIKNVTVLVKQLNDYMLSILIIFSEGLILLGISLFLFYIEPVGSFVILAVMGVITIAFQKLLKKYLSKWGKSFEVSSGMRMHFLQEGFSAIKEIKLLGREFYFLNKFNESNKTFTSVGQKYQTVQFVPKAWLEMTAVSSIVIFIMILVYQDKDPSTILLTLSIFAAATFKLIPSLSRIVGSYQTMLYTKNSVKLLLDEIELTKAVKHFEEISYLPFEKDLVLENICFKYENTEKLILDKLNVTIPCNSLVGIVGTTGEGKSTFVDVILGLLKPSFGTIKIDGLDVSKTLRTWQSKIGYVPQNIVLIDDTIQNNIAFGIDVSQINDNMVQKAIKLSHLTNFINSLPEGVQTMVGERGVRLSGGQRQRIGIARALYSNPSVIILDEATSSLDNATEKSIMNEINEFKNDKTIIVIAHRTNTLEKCDFIYQLKNGKVEMIEKHKIIN